MDIKVKGLRNKKKWDEWLKNRNVLERKRWKNKQKRERTDKST